MESGLKRVSGVVVLGTLLVLLPYWFWYTFVRSVSVGPDGSATIASRFDGELPEPTVSVEPAVRLRELVPYPSTALTYDRLSRNLRFYESMTGRAFEVSPTTLRVQPLSESRLENFVDSVWSPNGVEVISSFHTGGRTEYRYYDYRSGRFAVLDARTTRFAFSPDGSRIVASVDTGTSLELWVSLPDGTGAWRLFSTRVALVDLQWPHDDAVAILSERPNGSRDLSLIDLDGTLTMLAERRTSLEVLWAPDGDTALLSEEHDGALTTSVLRSSTGAETPVAAGVKVSKCAWHSRSDVFTCGIPDFGESARAAASSLSRHDVVVSFDVRTGDTTVRFEPDRDVAVSVTAPVVLPSGSGLGFINRFDQKPYLVTW